MRSRFLAWCLAAMFCLGAQGPGTAENPEAYLVFGHTNEVRRVDEKGITEFNLFTSPTEVFSHNGLSFNLFYIDILLNLEKGFDGPNAALARQRVRDTLTVVADTLNETGALDILFLESPITGSGALASAGTYFFIQTDLQTGTAFQRIQTGVKPIPNREEINVTVNFGYDFNFTTAPTLFGQFDFITLLLHEFTHGLGVTSLSNSTGASAIRNASLNIDPYTTWNARIAVGQSGSPLWSGDPPAFQGVASDLTGGNLFFTGTEANGLFPPTTRPPIHAPATFNGGSSLSHWAQNIPGGAVMRPFLPTGENFRAYAPVEVGALRDLGYSNAAIPGSNVVVPPAYVTGPSLIEEGNTLRLGLSIMGFTVSDYQWFKDDVALPGETNPVLEIENVGMADSGFYKLAFSGALNKASSETLPHSVTVVPVGTLPLHGGLAALAAGLALAGILFTRQKPRKN